MNMNISFQNRNRIKIMDKYNTWEKEHEKSIDNIAYGYNGANALIELETIELPNPIIVATNNEGKKKICIDNCFSTDYEYDGIRQLYISPSLIRLYMRIDSSKRQLLNYIYVYKTGESGDRFCGIMDCNGNIVMPIKYKRIVNYDRFVLADHDVYHLQGDSFYFVCKIEEDANLIALCGSYMAFEEEKGNTFVIDYKGNRYQEMSDDRYIDLPGDSYFDIEIKSFCEVERNVPDYDSGPSWEELGKDEEDYIINNGGDWILDVG